MRFSVLLLVILGILTVPVARCLYAGSDVVEVRSTICDSSPKSTPLTPPRSLAPRR